MDKYCKACKYRPKCEETRVKLCFLKDNEHVVKRNGKWVIKRDLSWLEGLETK